MSSTPLTQRELELQHEATRLTCRYIDEVVLAYRLCPWAEPAIRTQRISIQPMLGRFLGQTGKVDAARSLQELLAQTPPETQLVLAPFPEVSLNLHDFEGIARELRSIGEKTFALAVFHPDPVRDVSDASRAVALLRRSPDPMIQAVRTHVLDELAADVGEGTMFVGADTLLSVLKNPAKRSVRQRVLHHNFATLNEVGQQAVEATLDNIQRDREDSYARIERRAAAGGST